MEAVEEPPELDPAMPYYQLDDGADTVFPPMPVRTQHTTQLISMWVM